LIWYPIWAALTLESTTSQTLNYWEHFIHFPVTIFVSPICYLLIIFALRYVKHESSKLKSIEKFIIYSACVLLFTAILFTPYFDSLIWNEHQTIGESFKNSQLVIAFPALVFIASRMPVNWAEIIIAILEFEN
jgi:hypothetical protein